MFTKITQIRNHVSLTQMLRRETNRNNAAIERMQNEQRIRVETMNYLSVNGMLKDGVS